MRNNDACSAKAASLKDRIANIRMTDGERGMLKNQLYHAAGERTASFYNWMSGKTEPPLSVMIEWARILGTTVEILADPLCELHNPYETEADMVDNIIHGKEGGHV